MKNLAIIFGKVILVLILAGTIAFTHWTAYNEGGQRGYEEGQHNVAGYVYKICSNDEDNLLVLYRTEFHCATLQKL